MLGSVFSPNSPIRLWLETYRALDSVFLPNQAPPFVVLLVCGVF